VVCFVPIGPLSAATRSGGRCISPAFLGRRRTIAGTPRKSNHPLAATPFFPAAQRYRGKTARVGAWFEAGLDVCVFLLPPLLVLAPHGAAPLAAAAGLCALGIVALHPDRSSDCRLGALRFPASLSALLLLWGGISAGWSIDPWRSLLIDARLSGLIAAGLALVAAAGLIAAPRRLALLLLAGTGLAMILAGGDLASGGGVTRYLSVRPFAASRFNQIAAWMALLLLPTAALLIGRHRHWLALAAAAMMAAAVCLLADTTAKIGLAASLPVAALCYCRRAAVARVAAALAVALILTAPLSLPQLARLPGVFTAVDTFKGSAGHRLLIWSFTGDRIAERPFAGWGLDAARAIPGGADEIRPGQQWLPLHPHDAALQVWLELGAPGAALFALLVGWLWLRLGGVPWPRVYAAAAAGSLTAALAPTSASWGIWEEWWLGALALALFAIIVAARVAAADSGPP
jgi:exopolysaccharide production protein ExoQ